MSAMKEPVILCVDDEEIVLRSLKRELNDVFGQTHLIELAEGGEDALDVLEELLAAGHVVPVIISDYIMPDLKGDELLQRVHQRSPHTRTIMLTGQASTQGITNAVNQANLYRYIAKPWEQQDLVLTVSEAIRSHAQERELEQKHLELARLNQALQEYNRTLEQRVTERTQALHASFREIEQANRKIMESIEYATRIQRSLLPDPNLFQTYLPQSFVLWMPRDIVGGDFYFTDFFDEGCLIAVLDCTGHGIPGALMTMIAFSALKRVIRDDGCRRPGEILQRLNQIVKTSLHQETQYALSDDGLDIAICAVNFHTRQLTFAGAKLPLYYTYHAQLTRIHPDRHSIGYRRSQIDFVFREHEIPLQAGMNFYLCTDGYLDQLGGDPPRRFGSRRLEELLRTQSAQSFAVQREVLLQTFRAHQGDGKQQDDLTIFGMGF